VSRTLADWLALQERVHARSIDLGLERVSQVTRALALERPPYRVITVAGTNGKGSTVAYLEALLRALGRRGAALTSPHLIRYNERIHIDGVEVDDAALIDAFERIERARGATTLTFFEYNTLAALLLFADRRVEVAVLEVGLGGRLDATNVLDADVAVLCSVGFDHRDWLGDTLEAIGAEKAGIFRAGRPAVLGHPQMPATVHAAIERLGALPIRAEREFSWEVMADRWRYQGLTTTLSHLPPPALLGCVQYRNAATALAALEALGISLGSGEAVGEALRSVRLPGRFQIVPGAVEWILDVAHNEPAALVLAQNLRARAHRGRTFAVCGILTDKDAGAIARALQDEIDEWIVCPLPGPRGSSASETAARLAVSRAVTLADSVAAGCARARASAQLGDRVIVFGSFVTVGSALEWLGLY
jgi:dihydrofolate synthase/folylpolyglutamate synthase